MILDTPNGAEVWSIGESRDITWQRKGSISRVKIEYSTNNGQSYDEVIASSIDASLGRYTWSIPDAIGAQVRVKITDASDSSVYDTSDASFTIKGRLRLISPNGREEWVVGSSSDIKWQRIGSISNVRLEYSTDAGRSYPYLIVNTIDAGAGSYTWQIPDAIGDRLRVRVVDVNNPSVYDASDKDFRIKGTLTLTAPNGSEVWGIGSAQHITWQTVGSIKNIKIEYSTDRGMTYPYTIASSVTLIEANITISLPSEVNLVSINLCGGLGLL